MREAASCFQFVHQGHQLIDFGNDSVLFYEGGTLTTIRAKGLPVHINRVCTSAPSQLPQQVGDSRNNLRYGQEVLTRPEFGSNTRRILQPLVSLALGRSFQRCRRFVPLRRRAPADIERLPSISQPGNRLPIYKIVSDVSNAKFVLFRSVFADA